jgi:hypothetical protein
MKGIGTVGLVAAGNAVEAALAHGDMGGEELPGTKGHHAG